MLEPDPVEYDEPDPPPVHDRCASIAGRVGTYSPFRVRRAG